MMKDPAASKGSNAFRDVSSNCHQKERNLRLQRDDNPKDKNLDLLTTLPAGTRLRQILSLPFKWPKN